MQMTAPKTIEKVQVFKSLQREILALSGLKPSPDGSFTKLFPPSVNASFPGNEFPLAALHEFYTSDPESWSATGGFLMGILSRLMKNAGPCIWVGSHRFIFPPALVRFGVQPDRVIFLQAKKAKDILWAIEECLRCENLAAVIGDVKNLSFNVSRRLQLAIETSKVPGFIIRDNSFQQNITASVTRWNITTLPSQAIDNLPGLGYPRWRVELMKVRNGRTGKWDIFYDGKNYRVIPKLTSIPAHQQLKTG